MWGQLGYFLGGENGLEYLLTTYFKNIFTDRSTVLGHCIETLEMVHINYFQDTNILMFVFCLVEHI